MPGDAERRERIERVTPGLGEIQARKRAAEGEPTPGLRDAPEQTDPTGDLPYLLSDTSVEFLGGSSEDQQLKTHPPSLWTASSDEIVFDPQEEGA